MMWEDDVDSTHWSEVYGSGSKVTISGSPIGHFKLQFHLQKTKFTVEALLRTIQP